MAALDEVTIVLTGAASGIGNAVARRYLAEGANLVAVDVSSAGLQRLTDEFADRVAAVRGDVSTWETNQSAVAAARDRFGPVDVFVGVAGIFDGGVALGDLDGAALPAAFHELFGINVLGMLLGVRAAHDDLVARKGAVILTGSFASTHPSGGGSLYTASKHAVLGLVRQLAYELAPDVRVNGVAPGVAATRLKGIGALGQEPSDSVLEGTKDVLPLREIPDASAYGGIYTLLASRAEAAAMTGTMVTVDSGLDIRGLGQPAGRLGRS